jgi:hypothetical protein
LNAERTLRKLLPYSSAGLVIAILYVAWTFFSRWHDTRSVERVADVERARADAKIVEMYGSGNLKIMHFYAIPGLISRGQKGLICYGVANAKTVRIDPGVEPLKPSISRCLEISPATDTRYTFTAEDESGHSATASVLVRVQ